jgi:Tol biopolymer transport system component
MSRALCGAALSLAVLAARIGVSLAQPPGGAPAPYVPPAVTGPEPHLANVTQITFGGENAEAYWSPDGKQLVFQSTRDGASCDAIYVMDADGKNVKRVSSGKGRTTCAYFLPDGKRILYASTHAAADTCPAPPDRSHGYVWAVYPSYDLWTVDLDGKNAKRLTETPGYDAEATISPDGKRIVWTSVRGGDLDLWSMNLDGTDVKQLTNRVGYDGGAFFSPDSKQIVWRAGYPDQGDLPGFNQYTGLLAQGLVKPGKMDLWIMDADGKNPRQVTTLAGASFAPYFTPDGSRILFSSNYEDPKGRSFELYLIGTNGQGLEKVTSAPPFNSFPMFSPDGKRLVFASNRNAKERGETNLFVADWKDAAAAK